MSLAGPFQRCPSGDGGCRFEPMGRFHDRSGRIGEVTVARCRDCGIGVTGPALPDVSVLYADRSSNDFQPDAGGPARTIKRVAYRRQAAALLAMLPERPAAIIDYGCGSAIFTNALAEAAPGATVTALDFHEAPPPGLSGVEYLPFARADERAGHADLVIALHVLEHDDRPQRLLGDMAALLRPGGHLLLEVPNVECVWAGLFGPAWDGWYVPYHRLHFSPASLAAAVREAGLELIVERQASVPTIGRTIANLLGVRNSLPLLLAGAVLHPVQVGLEALTGRRSAIRVLARKR